MNWNKTTDILPSVPDGLWYVPVIGAWYDWWYAEAYPDKDPLFYWSWQVINYTLNGWEEETFESFSDGSYKREYTRLISTTQSPPSEHFIEPLYWSYVDVSGLRELEV